MSARLCKPLNAMQKRRRLPGTTIVDIGVSA
jgi:hypothetical protein